MKTTISQSIRMFPVLLAIVLALCANAAEEPCVVTARFMLTADQQDALADLNVALANANNGATVNARESAAKRAARNYKNALEGVRKQFIARRTLCHALGEVRYNPKIDLAR